MRILICNLLSLFIVIPAYAQVPVIDDANLDVAKHTAQTTDEILDTNKRVLDTVDDTLKAVTGERGRVSNAMQGLALGTGFSVAQMPGLDQILASGMANFGTVKGDIATSATTFLNSLKLLENLSGQKDSGFASDMSYQQLVKTVLGTAAVVEGAQQAVQSRRSALEAAGASIGQAPDIKGSLDQNTQLQVQSGLTINELIGVMNSAVMSLQADNQRRLTDMSNSKKALTYNRE
ncbi:type IV secretion system protein [Neorhizobium sp. NCHU2750]|uniref:type IV secretion system protein n=1 Tax=Neorhizobium sp. NCHU2750 TaxID=1825976 RepID=UPI000E74E449|nr:hypothetical protein NCHU2750_12400 [Neorhizobium sp. NCHU2750]